jgi:hypothetical protein
LLMSKKNHFANDLFLIFFLLKSRGDAALSGALPP